MVGELVVNFIQNAGISVLLAQDPPRIWLMKSQISDYHIFAPQGLDSLTLILVKKTISASLIPVGGARVCVVAMSLGRVSISFISGYVQPMTGVGSAELGRALKMIGDDHQKCLGMDGNGHSPVWGLSSVDSNPQGILLENLLASEDLVVINAPDSPPTYVGDDGLQSWLDVMAISASLMEQVVDWHVEEDAGLGSNHALISWELMVSMPNAPIKHRLNWQKVDWFKFRSEL